MEPNPRHTRPEIEEFLSICDRLIPHLTDEESKEIECIMFVVRVRQQTVHPYGELDDLSASLAFAKLPSLH
jgi:hypothetical protein